MQFLKSLLSPRDTRRRREAEAFLGRLREMSDRDVGLVVAIAAHQRNALRREGQAVDDLSRLQHLDRRFADRLASAVVQLNRRGQHHDAFGLLVWLHSVRAVQAPGLTDLGMAMWTELKRGMPHVAAEREVFREETGFALDISHAGEVPPRLDAER